MLAVVLLCGFSFYTPQTVKASSFFSIDQTELNEDGSVYKDVYGKINHTTFSFQCNGADATMIVIYGRDDSSKSVWFDYVFLSKDKLSSVKCTSVSDNGETSTFNLASGGVTSNANSTYYYVFSSFHGGFFKYGYDALTCITTPADMRSHGSQSQYIKYYVDNYLNFGDEWTNISGGTDSIDKIPDGSQDNPYKKDDFGYPQIYNSTYIHNDPNNLETLDKLYSGQDFQWKKKTTTGFDLTNNDYNYTYIECKVKANYQYNDKFSGKGSWHNFDSYGEMGNLGKVRAESLSHYYTFQEFQEALPKTSNELPDHKMRAIKSSAVYYFRVVCMKTSSTVVIPDEKDCKYYAGPWRSVTVTKINGKDGTSVVEDGEFDENGEWKKDDDSGDNGKDIDNGSAEGDDLNDASDKAHETINSNTNKSTLDLDSAKAFINQVADVPKMIGDIFSFFPDWVKYTVELGFAFIFILIVYKLIRG